MAGIISQHFIQYHLYADDSQLYTSLGPDIDNQSEIVSNLKNCIADISKWMSTNKLKLNQDKTEFILFGNSIQRNKMLVNSITVSGSNISSSKYVRNLGVYLDQEFSMEKHVNQLCKSCYFQLRNIRYIRSSLTTEAAKIVVHALAMSKLDYCNSILFGIPNMLLDKL